MREHPPLTERQRVVIAAVVSTGHVKGAAVQLGISESGAYARVAYAGDRCGCTSLFELIFHHHRELQALVDGVTSPTTGAARSA